ncbi:ribonuclease H-like domain-containing protein [Ruegeria sp.]|uniref:ribonuclease H-like domain-containing protein n=1 Tax=Ruegeria sp. TaxID=1879320 RepID=UPI003B593ACE
MNIQAKMTTIEERYASQRFVYFDLETIPCQDPDYAQELERKVKAPGNIKKPESIEKWLSENRKSAAQDAMAKTSFDGGRGHICTIAWAKNDGEIKVSHAKSIGTEAKVLADFFNDLDEYHSETLVGHNIVGFDVGFLRKRAVSLGMFMPGPTSFPRDPKPWDKNVNDTMAMWAGAGNRISLDELCKVLGIKGKEGFDGSMVASAWAEGDHDTIKEYCRDDVWRVREIHKRFLQVGF